jgi:hypothetical protein
MYNTKIPLICHLIIWASWWAATRVEYSHDGKFCFLPDESFINGRGRSQEHVPRGFQVCLTTNCCTSSQNSCNICSGTILNIMHFCGRMRHGVTIWNPLENQQACKLGSPLHPAWKNSSHKHPLVQVMMTVFFYTDRPLLLDFKSYYDTINANRYCQAIQSCAPRSRTITATSLTVSPCYMIVHVPKWPIELRTDQMPCNWRCSNILHIGQTYHHTIFTALRSLKKAI